MNGTSESTLRFLGATGAVAGSRCLVESSGHHVLAGGCLLQGYKQLREHNKVPFPVDPASIGVVVLTHAHLGHSGYLPALTRKGLRGHLHCTHGGTNVPNAILIGADSESEQWVARIAVNAAALGQVLSKQRRGGNDVRHARCGI